MHIDTVLSSNVGGDCRFGATVRVRRYAAIAAKFVQNDNYKEGMTTSIHMGAASTDA